MKALATPLVQPDAVAIFVAASTTEWNRLSAESGGKASLRRREVNQVGRQLSGLLDVNTDGLWASGLQHRLDGLVVRRDALCSELRGSEARQSALRLHPNLSEVYLARVARGLNARVEVHPPAVLAWSSWVSSARCWRRLV